MGLSTERRAGSMDEASLRSYLDWMSTPQGRRFFVRFMGSYRVAVRPELPAGLRSIDCPCAVIWGTSDPYLSTDIARSLAAGIPDATLHLIENAGHFVTETRPNDVCAALRELLVRSGAAAYAPSLQ